MTYNLILVFKNQGDQGDDDTNNLAKDDFLLAFQTKNQRNMMTKFGEKCICMDDTYGTNIYDFNLITVLVVDAYGKGILVAWALANRVDAAMLVEFLKAIRERIGPIKTDIFMSDMAKQFFTA